MPHSGSLCDVDGWSPTSVPGRAMGSTQQTQLQVVSWGAAMAVRQ